MKTVDFLTSLSIAAFAIGCGSSLADSSQKQSAILPPPQQLVLTLPDQGMQSERPSFSGMRKVTENSETVLVVNNGSMKSRNALKLGCNVDVAQSIGGDESIRNRLVGDCKFNYRY